MAGLLWFCGRRRAKEHPCQHRHTIYRVGLPKRDPSNDVCSVITLYTLSTRSSGWHVLHNGPGNACWQKHQKMFPSLYSQNYAIYWGLTKAGSLSNACTGTYQCRKVSRTLRGQFSLLHMFQLFQPVQLFDILFMTGIFGKSKESNKAWHTTVEHCSCFREGKC